MFFKVKELMVSLTMAHNPGKFMPGKSDGFESVKMQCGGCTTCTGCTSCTGCTNCTPCAFLTFGCIVGKKISKDDLPVLQSLLSSALHPA
jgi:hypothetical protein